MTLLIGLIVVAFITAFLVGKESLPVPQETTPYIRMDGFLSTYPDRWMWDDKEIAPRRVLRIDYPEGASFNNLLDDTVYQWIYVGEEDFDLGFECDLFGVYGEAYSPVVEEEIPPINPSLD